MSLQGALRLLSLNRSAMTSSLANRYQAPFDRHDWEVYRPSTHSKIRYIIDFYPGRGADALTSGRSGTPNLAFYIDVRPALDGWEGARMRWLRTWSDIKATWSGQPRVSQRQPR